MKKVLIPIFIAILVVFVSGCIENGGGWMGIGAEQEDAPDDILDITRFSVIPDPPIDAGNDFELSFLLRNLHHDLNLDAEGVELKLYDDGRCDRYDGDDIDGDTIYGGAEREIRWDFKTPDSDDIGRMPTECSIRFMLGHEFDASTTHDVNIISREHVEELDRRGEGVTVSPRESRSHGPIKIHVNFWRGQPFLDGDEVGFGVQIYNRGDGAIDVDRTDMSDSGISIEYDGQPVDCEWPEDELYFIDDRTPEIRCTIDAELEGDGPLEEKSVSVEIEEYFYTMHFEERVPVAPR